MIDFIEDRRVLITGASGLLGHHLATEFVRDSQVTGLCLSHAVDVAGVREISVKMTNADDLQRVFESVRPTLVIHTAGLTNVDQCENEPALAQLLNVQVTESVAMLCKLYGAKLVHISTDHLWDGSKPFVCEDDPVIPLNVYAKTKALAEEPVLALADSLVVRTNFYGAGRSWRPSFSDWIISRLQGGLPLRLFDDVFYTPIAIPSLISLLRELLRRDASGVFNLVGRDRVSKYEFGLRLAERLGYRAERIQRSSVHELALHAPRPQDMSLSSRKLEDFLGLRAPSTSECFDRLWAAQVKEAQI